MLPHWTVGAFCVCLYVLFGVILVRVLPCRFGKRKIELLKERFPYCVTRIAHRGGSLIGPENTMFTFRRAILEGDADILELDVHDSKDGEIVVSHDADLVRTCGSEFRNKKVSDIVVCGDPGKSLPQLLRRIPLHFSCPYRGDYYEAADTIPVDETTRVCLLSEVFDTFQDSVIHLDIKCEGADFTRRVLKMVERYGRESRTFVGSSNWRNRRHISNYFKSDDFLRRENLRQKRQRFRIFAGPVEYVIVHMAYYIGLLPLLPLDFDVFSIPLFTKWRRKQFSSRIARFISYFLNSSTLWNHLQRRGILVIGWVLNGVDEFEEASKWPINGIMSDDPIALKAFFDSRDVSATMNLLE